MALLLKENPRLFSTLISTLQTPNVGSFPHTNPLFSNSLVSYGSILMLTTQNQSSSQLTGSACKAAPCFGCQPQGLGLLALQLRPQDPHLGFSDLPHGSQNSGKQFHLLNTSLL